MSTSWDDFKNRLAIAEQPAPQAAQYAQSTSYLFTLRSGVFLPLLQSIVTGILVGLTCLVWAIAAEFQKPALFFAVVTLGITFISWGYLMINWRTMVSGIEKLVNRDLNGDNRIGDKPASSMVQVRVTSMDGKHTTIAEIPHADKLPEFAQGVLAGKPISKREWIGRGKLFGETEFNTVRDKFIQRGWMVWIDEQYPQLGLNLTITGQAAMRALANSDTHSPTLRGDTPIQ